jgi:excinuclease UvrABC nuclease subunit
MHRPCLYRLFDKSGRLLYVGATVRPIKRVLDHRATKDWFEAIANMTFAFYDTRGEAEAAETLAINSENPQFNVRRQRRGKIDLVENTAFGPRYVYV